MKQGKSLEELAREITRQAEAKRDYVAPAKKLQMLPDATMEVSYADQGGTSGRELAVDNLAHRQVGQWAGIHAKYYDKMREQAPALLAENVNHWFGESDDVRLVRTLDQRMRAFLSDRYQIIDHYEVAQAILPILKECGAEIDSCEVTERHLYIKAFNPNRKEEIGPAGVDWKWGEDHHQIHVLRPGIVLRNSEVGLGSYEIAPGLRTDHCSNLLVFRADAMRKYHIGRKLTEGQQEIERYITDETKRKRDQALMAVATDMTRAAFDGEIFEKLVDETRKTRGHVIEGRPDKAIEEVAKLLPMNQEEQGGVLRHLAQGGELSQYGLSNAVTQFSQQEELSYDRASELEEMGAKIIALAPKEWQTIAVAA